MSSVTEPLPSLTPEVLKLRRAMDSPSEDSSDPERADAHSVSPVPPAASPPGSPVMLATMTPVSVLEYEEQEAAASQQQQQKTVIFIPPNHQNPNEPYNSPPPTTSTMETSNGPVSVVVQPPGSQLMNHSASYQGPPGTTVLVLSELVEDMSPLLNGLRLVSNSFITSFGCFGT